MRWGSGWGARFDAKGHGVADCSHPVKGFASGFATLDCLLPICCAATKATMDRPCLPAIHFLLLPGVDPAIFLGDLLRHFLLDEHTPVINDSRNMHYMLGLVNPKIDQIVFDWHPV